MKACVHGWRAWAAHCVVGMGLVVSLGAAANAQSPDAKAEAEQVRGVLMLQFARATARPGSDVSRLALRDPSSYVERHG